MSTDVRTTTEGAVAFRDLHRHYGEVRALDGLDLELPAGLCTAIVGVNGAGKTTLVKLLTRLHEPTAGRLTVDGTDLADLDVALWRRQVSVVFQDFVRYELSASDNIRVGAVREGDLVLVDEVTSTWGVVELAEPDLDDEELICLDWRGDADDFGSLSLSVDVVLTTRRPSFNPGK